MRHSFAFSGVLSQVAINPARLKAPLTYATASNLVMNVRAEQCAPLMGCYTGPGVKLYFVL